MNTPSNNRSAFNSYAFFTPACNMGSPIQSQWKEDGHLIEPPVSAFAAMSFNDPPVIPRYGYMMEDVGRSSYLNMPTCVVSAIDLTVPLCYDLTGPDVIDLTED